MAKNYNAYLFIKNKDSECQLASSLLDIKGFIYEICDENSSLIEKYGVGIVPALLIVDGNGIVDEARGIEQIKSFIDAEL